MFGETCILNLHIDMGNLILDDGRQAVLGMEDESYFAGTHLAAARDQNPGNGISGYYPR